MVDDIFSVRVLHLIGKSSCLGANEADKNNEIANEESSTHL